MLLPWPGVPAKNYFLMSFSAISDPFQFVFAFSNDLLELGYVFLPINPFDKKYEYRIELLVFS